MKKMNVIYVLMMVLMAGMVSALTIVSPTATTYDENAVLLNVTHNETLDNITYELDNISHLGCDNCSNYSTMLNVSDGNHTLIVMGESENVSVNDSVNFTVDTATKNFLVNINKPVNTTYNTSSVPLNITANDSVDTIKYSVDGTNYTGCSNCSAFNTTLNLADGDHMIVAYAMVDFVTKMDNVSFMVDAVNDSDNESDNFSLVVLSPIAKKYLNGTVPLNVTSNETLDNITATVDGQKKTCANCSNLSGSFNLDNGNYTLYVTGMLMNISKNLSVMFSVDENQTVVNGTNGTKTNKSNESRYTTGLEKLPQMVEAGNISDAELAQIIRSNKLNPGVLNRLIKTGMLGNESLNAILDTQVAPPGIFKKLMSFIGFKVSTVPSLIAENYVLDAKTEEKAIAKESLPKVKEKVKEEVENKSANKTSPGQAKKIRASENGTNTSNDTAKVSAGQVKKVDVATGNGKVPPGQAKKNN
ncbi:MAG TPA: hypothetical protein VK158_06470 [Acidobacteriota bacterium]|nr:hypothetical protein [Acidobacteriota bacterium]